MNCMGKATGISFASLVLVASLSAGCSTTDATSARASSTGTSEDTDYVARVEPEEEKERLICRREKPTGSRISEKICLTAEDWERIEQQSQEMLNRTTRKAQQYEDQ